ncbi:bifunctional diguanylate cyclase/phosphodiesterase [Vibrio coralliirubri]|uniref:bifunctional diguanylate cyclase/phosphodiesterase n=1 Tax=Vibrio coralliirubri TaxID=1516159 RepID=UPI000632DCC8|nr:EAL domain-containing protein [Vibrio coralliirubri]CDS98007.1 Sensory box/GGDEF family protein [Vibrio coralliirubri]CDU08892.1 Sensory box/GGDEF family protein [Vibrio coralliirubri]
MLHINDKKLVWFTKYLPITIIIFSAIVLNVAMFTSVDQKVKALVDLIRTDYISAQKGSIETQVLQVSQQIKHTQRLVEIEVKKHITRRLDRAYTAAQNIYSSNQHLPEEELKLLILNEIRKLSYADKKDYIYAYDMQGTVLVHPRSPELENTNQLETTDSRGVAVIKQQIALLKQNNGAYSRYFVPRPGFDGQDFEKPHIDNTHFEKLSYIRRFEPFDWYFGTGISLDDVKQVSYQRILEILSKVTVGDNGYLFVFEQNGDSLLHAHQIHTGQDLNVYDDLGNNFKQDVLAQAESGGFVDYITVDKQGFIGPKSSYVKKVGDWDWIVGTGVYLNNINASIEHRKNQLLLDSRNEFGLILILSVLATLLCIFISALVSRRISLRFDQMEQRISDDFNRIQNSRRRLQHMARHDSLTALPNRSELELQVSRAIAHSKLEGKLVALVFVDLDNFKRINDQYGHASGDELLKQIGLRFERILGANDIVSRFGGDEFVFCLSGIHDLVEAEEKVQQIQGVFKPLFNIHGASVSTQCSAGVSMYPYDGTEVEELLTKADIVLYKAKELNKGDAIFYDDVINQKVKYGFSVEEQLKTALAEGEFSVLYQPQVDSLTEQLKGVEALCRWHNSLLGFVSPLDFIPAAERIGKIHEIGEFVLRKACEDTLRLMPNGPEAVCVSVNVSPKQVFELGFDDKVIRLIEEVGIDPCRVTLELTENILIKDLHIVEPILKRLREYGFGISLDDFGTGFSSLNYLNTLPITEIKIDRSFIGKLNSSQHSETLVKAIIDIGASCQMKVVAEGVETPEQMEKLQQYHCDLLQGYYFDKPLSAQGLIDAYFPVEPEACVIATIRPTPHPLDSAEHAVA